MSTTAHTRPGDQTQTAAELETEWKTSARWNGIQRDYTLVIEVVIMFATLLLIMNLIGDILHALLDPKVRLS